MFDRPWIGHIQRGTAVDPWELNLKRPRQALQDRLVLDWFMILIPGSDLRSINWLGYSILWYLVHDVKKENAFQLPQRRTRQTPKAPGENI